ncbi:MAG: CHAT domain-containing protein [Xenococcaceae cyanobacterium]
MNFDQRNVEAFIKLLKDWTVPWSAADSQALAEWYTKLSGNLEQISLAILEWSEERPSIRDALSELRNTMVNTERHGRSRQAAGSNQPIDGQPYRDEIRDAIQTITVTVNSPQAGHSSPSQEETREQAIAKSPPPRDIVSQDSISNSDTNLPKVTEVIGFDFGHGETAICAVDRSSTRGNTDRADSSQLVTRYTDITCPRQVGIETPRVTAIVRLTKTPREYSEVVKELLLQSSQSVRVHIHAPNFEILNQSVKEIPIFMDADSPEAVFDLRPVQLGQTLISFDFFQAGNPVGTVSVTVEITSHKVSEIAEPRGGQLLQIGGNITPPDFMLYIRYQHKPTLEFELFRSGGIGQTFYPVELTGTPQSYAQRLYDGLTTLSRQAEPTVKSILKEKRIIPRDDVDRRIRKLGENLWREMIPPDLKDIYAKEREAWKNKTLLIVSDEPHIPWELIWPYGDDWEDEAPWCIQLRLTRWLRLDYQGKGNRQPAYQVSLNQLACIAPSDSGLPSASQERQFLSNLAKDHGLTDLSPDVPTWSEVLNLLENSPYSWLHVAAHGNFDVESPDADSGLWLQERCPLTPNMFVGSALERHIKKTHPGFVFNTCHSGRMGWDLVQLGGWANRLISNGAGLFVGSLWSVTDGPALLFAQTFYQELLRGKTIAEAVYQSRSETRKRCPGDPTWLAYSVYAHPNARV